MALLRIGSCLGHLGRRPEAIIAFRAGIDLVDELRASDYRQADALEMPASLLAEEGLTDESRSAYLRAAQVFETIGDTTASSRCRGLSD
ncbi:hypothetical protein ACODT3_37565 [Streptomyces sp. 4.24]|uniref:hypothetical protein n=1 Tax=Streptomyces tritrimontium TaxID=3406573 RepID=UPI003BB796CE